MLIRCQRCQALFSVQEAVAPPSGRTTFSVECGRCRLVFEAEAPKATGFRRMETALPVAPVTPPPPPASAPPVAERRLTGPDANEQLAKLLRPRRPGGNGAPSSTPLLRRPIVLGSLGAVALLLVLGAFVLSRRQPTSAAAVAMAERARVRLLLDDATSLEAAATQYAEAARLAPQDASLPALRAFSLLLLGGGKQDLARRLDTHARGLVDRVARLQTDKPEGFEEQVQALSADAQRLAAERDALAREGAQLVSQGLAAARAAYEEDTASVDAQRALALHAALSGSVDQGARHLEAAERGQPQDAMTAYVRGALALAGAPGRDKHDRALSALLRASYDMAAMSADRQEYGSARDALRRLLEQNPQHERARRLLELLPKPE